MKRTIGAMGVMCVMLAAVVVQGATISVGAGDVAWNSGSERV